jgi:serine/threonine protein kinase
MQPPNPSRDSGCVTLRALMTRYELTERIGAGAMAEIFRGKAVAAGGFEKPVAIKRILPHLSQDEHFVELLIAEANIVSHLRHRNVVQVFDVGMGADGQYFLVMELVDGCNLATVQTGLESRGKRMPAGLGLYIGAEICDALEHAHRAPGPDGKPLRLVHRDVSPNNVLLSRSGEVKLTDFGIAKRSEEVSLHGGVRGKFAYISPEQGSGRAVDARSDVFSVGILLFEMIVGRRLFSGLPDFEALRTVCEGKVPRPRSVDPKLDPKIEAIVLKALAHNPDERYASASDLGKDLRAYRYSLPSTSGDPAAELASLVTRIVRKGSERKSSESNKKDAPQGVRRPEPDDFSGGTNTFTVEEDQSLVRKTTYEEAWQRFRAEEGRVARTYQSARESGEMPSATMLGFPHMNGGRGSSQARDDHDQFGDVGEEETRVVDPILRSSRPVTRQSSLPGEVVSGRFMDGTSEDATFAIDANRLGALAGGSVATRLPGPAAAVAAPVASPMGAMDGAPPDTLELRGSQAHAMVDSVDHALVERQVAVPIAAPVDADARLPSSAFPRSRPSDPAAVVRVSTTPLGAATAARKGFPRWAVILFVVLLVGIILAGAFLSDGTTSTGAPAARTPPGAGMAVAEEAPSAQPVPAAPVTIAAPAPVDAGVVDAASAAAVPEEAQRPPRRERTPERPPATRQPRERIKEPVKSKEPVNASKAKQQVKTREPAKTPAKTTTRTPAKTTTKTKEPVKDRDKRRRRGD